MFPRTDDNVPFAFHISKRTSSPQRTGKASSDAIREKVRHALWFRAAQAMETRLEAERKRPHGRPHYYIPTEIFFEIALRQKTDFF
jgi:hypothetical protein